MRHSVNSATVGLLLAVLGAPVSGETRTLSPVRDATLIETTDGSLSNGSGPALFAGRTGQGVGSRRRALLLFDLSGIPADARIDAVDLTIDVSPSSSGPEPLSLHRALAPWSEGPASASGGGGAPSQPGDATWLHTVYDRVFWTAPGGDFAPEASASTVAFDPGPTTWPSTLALVDDVRGWLDAPETNHGWIVLGNETAPTTVKRFGSREEPDPALRPRLTIAYTLPCVAEPAGTGYWHRQCLALGAANGGSEPGRAGKGRGPDSLLEPEFAEQVLPCAESLAASLGVAGGICPALEPPAGGPERQRTRSCAAAALDLCSGRLRTSCPEVAACRPVDDPAESE